MDAKLTTDAKLRKARHGDIVIVPMGMIKPYAVLIESVDTDEDGQVCGNGIVVSADGCSAYDLGKRVCVCLGWKAPLKISGRASVSEICATYRKLWGYLTPESMKYFYNGWRDDLIDLTQQKFCGE